MFKADWGSNGTPIHTLAVPFTLNVDFGTMGINLPWVFALSNSSALTNLPQGKVPLQLGVC